jgi:endo-1,4-beta-D-glucanase Y
MMDDSELLTTYVEAHDKWVAETNPTSVGDAWLAGARAVAGAAWDEAIEAKYQQTVSGSPDSLPNPYREGTP